MFTCKHEMENPQQRNICRREEKGFSTRVPPYHVKWLSSIWRGEAKSMMHLVVTFFFNLEDCDFYIFVHTIMCMEQSILAAGGLGRGAASERGRPLGAQVAPKRGTRSG